MTTLQKQPSGTLVFLSFLMIYLCYNHVCQAQLKKIILLDATTSNPIPKASIFLEEENNGTVSDENGIARLGNTQSKNIRISHLNYNMLTIKTSDLTHEITTLKLIPRPANQLEEVIVSAGFDKLLVGKWKLLEIANIRILSDGTEHSTKRKTSFGNIKEYNADRSFIIISSNGSKQLSGRFTALNNQIYEDIEYSYDQSLQGITNILFYSKTEKDHQIRVKYQLPNSVWVTEEIWKKL